MDLKENEPTPKGIKVEKSDLERTVKVKAVFDSFYLRKFFDGDTITRCYAIGENYHRFKFNICTDD